MRTLGNINISKIKNIILLIILFLCVTFVYMCSPGQLYAQEGEFVGYSLITVNELGKVDLSEPIYESDLEAIPGIPVYRYITNEEEVIVQVKAYMYSKTDRKYILDYIINVDNDLIIILRAVFKYEYDERLIDFIEYYCAGKLERIEYFEDGTKIVAIERFDESGIYTTYLGKDAVVYIDPYGFYNTYTYMEDDEMVGYGVYYPNNELILRERNVDSSIADLILVYDKDNKTRTVKTLDSDRKIIKEEIFDEKGKLVFCREYEYDGEDYAKITIIEEVRILDGAVWKNVTQKIIFYFENAVLVTRERYLDDELISSTSYDGSITQEDDVILEDENDEDEDMDVNDDDGGNDEDDDSENDENNDGN